MAKNKYEFDTIIEGISSIVSASMMANAKNMLASPEAKKTAVGEALKPFMNEHNIKMLFSEKNIAFVRDNIIKNLPKLDKHYIVYAEPTEDRKDVLWRLIYRQEGSVSVTITQAEGYLSQLNQEQIMQIIHKFLPNGATTDQPGANPGQ